MGTKGPWNWSLSALKMIKIMLVRPLMTNLEMTVRDDCAVSVWSPPTAPPLFINILTRCFVRGGRVGLRQKSATAFPPPVASIWNKANFPFNQPGLLTGFWVEKQPNLNPSPPCPQHTHTFSNKSTCRSNGKPFFCITLSLDVCKELIIYHIQEISPWEYWHT